MENLKLNQIQIFLIIIVIILCCISPVQALFDTYIDLAFAAGILIFLFSIMFCIFLFIICLCCAIIFMMWMINSSRVALHKKADDYLWWYKLSTITDVGCTLLTCFTQFVGGSYSNINFKPEGKRYDALISKLKNKEKMKTGKPWIYGLLAVMGIAYYIATQSVPKHIKEGIYAFSHAEAAWDFVSRTTAQGCDYFKVGHVPGCTCKVCSTIEEVLAPVSDVLNKPTSFEQKKDHSDEAIEKNRKAYEKNDPPLLIDDDEKDGKVFCTLPPSKRVVIVPIPGVNVSCLGCKGLHDFASDAAKCVRKHAAGTTLAGDNLVLNVEDDQIVSDEPSDDEDGESCSARVVNTPVVVNKTKDGKLIEKHVSYVIKEPVQPPPKQPEKVILKDQVHVRSLWEKFSPTRWLIGKFLTHPKVKDITVSESELVGDKFVRKPLTYLQRVKMYLANNKDTVAYVSDCVIGTVIVLTSAFVFGIIKTRRSQVPKRMMQVPVNIQNSVEIPAMFKESKKFVKTPKGKFNVYNFDSDAVVMVGGIAMKLGDEIFTNWLTTLPEYTTKVTLLNGDKPPVVVMRMRDQTVERVRPKPSLKKESVVNIPKKCKYCKEIHRGHAGCRIELESLRQAHKKSIVAKLQPESLLGVAQRLNVDKFHNRMFKLCTLDGDFINNAFCFGERLITTLHGVDSLPSFLAMAPAGGVLKITDVTKLVFDSDLVSYRIPGVQGERIKLACPEDGEDCILLAFDEANDRNPKISSGVVNKAGYHTCPSITGNCGGVLLNMKGEVIGIHQAGSDKVNKAVPLTPELIKSIQAGFH